MESTSYPVGIVSYFLVLASFTVSTPQSLMKNLWNRPWKYGIPILAKFFCLYRITEENNLPRRRTRISWPGDSKLLPGRCQTRQDGERIGKIGERKGVRMYIRLYSDPYAHVSPNLLFGYSASTVEYLVASAFVLRCGSRGREFLSFSLYFHRGTRTSVHTCFVYRTTSFLILHILSANVFLEPLTHEELLPLWMTLKFPRSLL